MDQAGNSYSLESNGRAKMLSIYFMDKACAMVNHLSPRLKKLWSEVVTAACYTRNWMYGRACQVKGVTPIDEVTGIKPNGSERRVFGCMEYMIIGRQSRSSKVSNHARQRMMVGYIGRAYRILIPATARIIISRYVRTV